MSLAWSRLCRRGARCGLAGVVILALWARGPVAAQVEPEAVPSPDLSAMEEGVRRSVEAMQGALRQAVERDVAPAELAEGFAQLGYRYLAFELLDAAESVFATARELAPEDFRWPYYLGIVEQSKGKLEDAAAAYEAVLELRSDDLPTLLRLGDVYLDRNDTERSRQLYTRARELAPDSAAAHYGLGKVAEARGEHGASVEHFEKTLELDPEATLVHYSLGQAYRKLGDLDKARLHLRRRGRREVTFDDPLGSRVAWLATGTAFQVVQALASDLESFSERDFLGFALSQLGDVEGAVEEIEAALERLPREAGVGEAGASSRRVRGRMHYLLGGLLVNRGSDAAARSHFEAALELDPDLEDSRIKLGNLLARAGDFAAAQREYSRVLERHPDHPAALLKRAAVRMNLRQDEAASEDLERLLKIDPGHGEARLRLARVQEGLGRLEKAAEHYRVALGLDLSVREKALTHYELGRLHLKQEDLDAARTQLVLALELDPRLEDAGFQLATLYGRAQDYAKAVELYRQLIEVDPEHWRARLGEVTSLILLGRDEEAKRRLEEGVAALPRSVEMTHALARHLASARDPGVRNGPRAVELARQVVQARSTLVHAETLAMAFAEAGRFEEAIKLQTGLVEQAQAKGDTQVLPTLRRNLRLYQERRACCDPP